MASTEYVIKFENTPVIFKTTNNEETTAEIPLPPGETKVVELAVALTAGGKATAKQKLLVR